MTQGQSPSPGPADPGPAAAIAALIRDRGPVSFDVFMDEALYGAAGGYYERGPAVIGREGDFYTAPDATPAFGWMLAEQIAQCSERLAETSIDIVELGPGKGIMAADILDRLAGDHRPVYERAIYWIVERSSAMRAAQAESLRAHAGRVRWAPDPDGIRPGGIVGCVLANEFYDALPVRVVTRRGGVLMERRVALAGAAGTSGTGFGPAAMEGAGGSGAGFGVSRERGTGEDGLFMWVECPAEDPDLVEYVQRYGAAPAEGAVAEAGLAARSYAGRVARAIRRGFQIVVDYGDRAGKLYDVRTRPLGTLLAYHRHRVVEDVLMRPGEQDLTAHVNFSALEDAARETGMETAGFTTQDRFLIALGLAERIAALGPSADPADIRSRRAMMSLIHPEGMGRIFRVLVLAKGASAESLKGLRDPFASSWIPSNRT